MFPSFPAFSSFPFPLRKKREKTKRKKQRKIKKIKERYTSYSIYLILSHPSFDSPSGGIYYLAVKNETRKDDFMKKTVDYIDLCRYDKELRYAVDVEVCSDKFLLGDKGDQLRFAVSEYGYNRLLTDSIDGLIDIKGSTLMIDAFDYPEITTESITEELNRRLEEGAERLELLFPKKGESNE